MKIGMWVIVLLLVVCGLLAFARGIACENYCAKIYSNQLAVCEQTFGENGERPDSGDLERCKSAIKANHDRCVVNCENEQSNAR
ncbi:MAG: hypothetical protein ACI4SG_01205 [Oligosphaeraceae bacterium]